VVIYNKNNLTVKSHFIKIETSLVVWLNIVTIVAPSVRTHAQECPRHSALSMTVWSMPCQTCKKRCFSSQHLFT